MGQLPGGFGVVGGEGGGTVGIGNWDQTLFMHTTKQERINRPLPAIFVIKLILN